MSPFSIPNGCVSKDGNRRKPQETLQFHPDRTLLLREEVVPSSEARIEGTRLMTSSGLPHLVAEGSYSWLDSSMAGAPQHRHCGG